MASSKGKEHGNQVRAKIHIFSRLLTLFIDIKIEDYKQETIKYYGGEYVRRTMIFITVIFSLVVSQKTVFAYEMAS